jgi:hypothetical protein
MVHGPSDAHARRLANEVTPTERSAEFLEIAEKRLKEVHAFLRGELPTGLTMTGLIGPAGLLGKSGVRSHFCRIFDDDEVVAQMAINCSVTETVILVGMPPDQDNRSNVYRGEIAFEAFSDAAAGSFLVEVITTYVV